MFLQQANPHTSSCGVGTPLTFQEEGPSELRGTGPKTGVPPASRVLGAASIIFGTAQQPPCPCTLPSIAKSCA